MREVDGAASFLAAAGIKPNELDVLDGSPPCCEFSAAGKGMRDQHELRRYSDVKQRDIATLPFDFVDLAVRIQPKVVVCENVPALAAQRSRGVLDRIVGALRFSDGVCRDRRYYADWAVLAANDFGVPQKRRRLFIIGVRVDVAESVGLKSDGDVLSLFPKPTGIGPTVASALFGLQQSSRDVFPWYRSAAATSLGATIRRLPKNPAKPIRLRHVSLSETRSFTLTRCSWDKPAPTLVVVAQQPTALSGAIHPDQDRKFTIPELKRLFALPDDFVLTGTLGQAAERICRMVPPPLTEAIAESVYHRVLLPYREGGRR
jgi:site-specific DNA-cytosine methylase